MTEKKELANTAGSAVAEQKTKVLDVVTSHIETYLQEGKLDLPADYSPHNAMKQAWLMLQDIKDQNSASALQVCTQQSIVNSLMSMVIQGLNVDKKQGYFIVYGKNLAFQRSYFGAMAVAKRVNPEIADFGREVIYEGDVLKYSVKNGQKIITEHTQEFGNVDNKKIAGAYCIALDENGKPIHTEIMTIEQIKQAWNQSQMKPVSEAGNVKATSTHGKFPADMALKTVISRCCKITINSSSDKALIANLIQKFEDINDRATVEAEITEKANTGPVMKIEDTAQEAEDDNHVMTGEAPSLTDDPGPAHCPNNDDKVTAWSVCVVCADLEGCPVR